MAFRAICVALLLSTLPVAGCGTAANLVRSNPDRGGKTPFGGVRHDVWSIRTAASGDCGPGTRPWSESEQTSRVVHMLVCTVDLPFSFVGDLVTWPYTVAWGIINEPIPVPPVLFDNPPVTQPILAPPVTQSTPTPPVTNPMLTPAPPLPQPPADGKPKTSP